MNVSGVDFSYGAGKTAKQVLFECDLSLRFGEVVIMTGPSGSGKTTLLTLIGALRSLHIGSIEVDGRELRGMRPSQLTLIRKHIGFIFQDHNLFEALTAGQTLRLAMQLFHQRYTRSDRHKRPAQMLSALGMDGHVDSRPDEMSTGQKQRVAIARALINDPPMVLADEPTASLDRETALSVMKLLRERSHVAGALVLIVSHDQRLFSLADRVIQVVDGRVISPDAKLERQVAVHQPDDNVSMA